MDFKQNRKLCKIIILKRVSEFQFLDNENHSVWVLINFWLSINWMYYIYEPFITEYTNDWSLWPSGRTPVLWLRNLNTFHYFLLTGSKLMSSLCIKTTYVIVDNPITAGLTLNYDLEKISKWAKQWLVQSNSTKLESLPKKK
jgi:hypothetical protein